MLKIYIARHGQNVDNLNGILNGHRDLPLTEKGVEQARELAEAIKENGLQFDFVYCSPLIRASETAKIISEIAKTPTPQVEQLLIERDHGSMAGEKISDIEKLCGPNIIKTEIITYFIDPPGAETFPEMMDRAGVLLEKLKSEHKDGSILLVCHGDIGKMLYAKYYEIDWETILRQFHFGNCELILLSEDSSADDSHILKFEQHNH